MDVEALAKELRDTGHDWRYSGGELVAKVSAGSVPGISATDKSNATDWELVKIAATCFHCGRSATDERIETAVDGASNVRSFCWLICRRIEHADNCPER
jgi:hypothetical protein